MQSMCRTLRFARSQSCHRICLCRSSQNRGISRFFSSYRIGGTGSKALRRLLHLVTTARVPRPQWPGCLLAFAGSLFRSRVEKKLAHLARRIAGDGSLARPRERLVHIGGFQYPETAHVLLGLGVWPIGDEHRTIRLLPHRLCVAGRGNSASELPHAGSYQFAVERVDLLDHRFGYGGRVEVVGEIVSNQILWHTFSPCFLWFVPDDSFPVHSGVVAHRSFVI